MARGLLMIIGLIIAANCVPRMLTINSPSGGINIISTNPINNPNNNFFLPTVPQPQPRTSPTHTPEQSANAQSCSNFLNTYWTGYRCSCRVGFRLDVPSGQCISILLIQPRQPRCP
jgi:hypothetical protein